MKQFAHIAFLPLLLCTIFSVAPCQEQHKYAAAGSFELGGNFSYEDHVYYSTYAISSYFGWFPFTDIEFALYPAEMEIQSSGIEKNTTFLILFAPAYNFKLSHTSYLFIEGLVGYTHMYEHGIDSGPSEQPSSPFTISDSGIAYGGHIGVKVAISNHALFNIGVQYLRTVYPIFTDMTYGYNDISLVAGFTVVL